MEKRETETMREMSLMGLWGEWEEEGRTREEILAGKVANEVVELRGEGGGGGEGKNGKNGFWVVASGGESVEKGYLGC